MATVALIITILFGFALIYSALNDGEAIELNLLIEGSCMANLGTQFRASIAPTNLAGNPAPVFDVTWAALGASYQVAVSEDGLSAIYTAAFPGAGNAVEVSARTKGGSGLAESFALPYVEDDQEAAALNLTVVPA